MKERDAFLLMNPLDNVQAPPEQIPSPLRGEGVRVRGFSMGWLLENPVNTQDSDSVNPKGIEINQPWVARNELPWVKRTTTTPSTLKWLSQSITYYPLYAPECPRGICDIVRMLRQYGVLSNPFRIDDAMARGGILRRLDGRRGTS